MFPSIMLWSHDSRRVFVIGMKRHKNLSYLYINMGDRLKNSILSKMKGFAAIFALVALTSSFKIESQLANQCGPDDTSCFAAETSQLAKKLPTEWCWPGETNCGTFCCPHENWHCCPDYTDDDGILWHHCVDVYFPGIC